MSGARRDIFHFDVRLRIHLASRPACDAAAYSDSALARLAVTFSNCAQRTRSPAKENAIPVRERRVSGQEAQSESSHASCSVWDGLVGLSFV
jgi:hypothetical protein